MDTFSFMNLLEILTDNWPENEINVDDLANKINTSIFGSYADSFIRDHGGCCLACAIDKYFHRSRHYTLHKFITPTPTYKRLECH